MFIPIAFAEPEKPTATFSADVTEGYAPLKVHFTSETTGDPISYFWTFEPQTSSDWNSHHEVTAGHTFQSPGVYDISLVVTNSAGSYTATKPHYITVLSPPAPAPADTPEPAPADMPAPTPTDIPASKPTATFSADVTEGYAPLKVHFTSETTGDPTSYFWTFEPQTSSDWNSHHEVTAGHTFQSPGVYDISLVVTNSAGSYTVTVPHYITVLAPPTPAPTNTPEPSPSNTPEPSPADAPKSTPSIKPTASFFADVKSGTVPLVVTFTDTSTGSIPASRYWNFGDGTNTAGGPTITHSFNKPGIYTVALTVTNDAGSDNECKNDYITVSDAPTCQPESVATLQPAQSPADQSEPTIRSHPANTPEKKPEEPSPSVELYGEKTDVEKGEDIKLKLSAVNLITKPTMHVQVILIPPSGMSVSSQDFSMSGAGQYTSNYTLEPGQGKDIEISIAANQIGDLNVRGRVVYYFGNNIKDAKDYTLDLPIRVSDSHSNPTPTTPKTNPIPGPGMASLVLLFIMAFILIRNKR